jgi:hypothetical protein
VRCHSVYMQALYWSQMVGNYCKGLGNTPKLGGSISALTQPDNEFFGQLEFVVLYRNGFLPAIWLTVVQPIEPNNQLEEDAAEPSTACQCSRPRHLHYRPSIIADHRVTTLSQPQYSRDASL